jgi:hypothetical protein
MDMNELYLVAVRLHGWEFMAEASHINAKKAVRGLAAAGDGTLAPGTKLADQEMTVHIGGTPGKITKRFCFVGDFADVFGIDTAVIASFDKNALIEKVVQGPPHIEGKWNLCTVMMAFAPTLYSHRRTAVSALAKTSIADYPSRIEVQMAHTNVSLLNFCTRNTNFYMRINPCGTNISTNFLR